MSAFNRFLRYVSFDTQSNPHSLTVPSTSNQQILAKQLVTELQSIGVTNVILSPEGIVYGFIPSNTAQPLPTVGFIAHMDTSFDFSGANVKPRIIKNYDGEPIVLNQEKAIVSDPALLTSLKDHLGKTLVVTDGTTLLGSDNKAGIAAIITAVEQLLQHPKITHGPVHIAFTPDEEIGKGTDHFNVTYFDCDFAYTVDGGSANEIEFENFNAASCKVTIQGLNTHPGSAKNIMLNSQHLAIEFHQQLPKELDPALTEGYQGFNHLSSINGSVESTQLSYIIRNHDRTLFEQQKAQFIAIQRKMNEQYHLPLVQVQIEDSYYNMKEKLDQTPEVIELARQAIQQVGLTPISHPIRGGTDGARLTYLGLPCPNLGTGGYYFHGPNEYLVVEELEKVVEILLSIVTLTAEKR